MIVWGGRTLDTLSPLDTGGRYDPASNTWTPTRTQQAPAARAGHTAVWTGTQMIVWGGFGSEFTNALNTGSRYTPASDSWSTVSTTSAPLGRYWHTAVWTGSEMIVWGGNTYDQNNAIEISLDTGARYSPATNSWTATAAAQAPSPRYRHTAVWSGNRMIVWGGTDTSATTFATGARYDPSTNSWSATSTTNTPEPRWAHTAVWTGTEMIVWGGGGNTYQADGGRYLLSSDTWTPIAEDAGSPPGRLNHTAVWTGTEMIVWGGTALEGETNTGGRFAPATGTWTPTRSNDPRPNGVGSTAIWSGAEMIVWGGDSGIPGSPARGSRYDPATDSWFQMSDHYPLCGHSVVWTGTEMIEWGGDTCQNFGGYPYGSRYNPATDSWTDTTTFLAPSGRIDHSAVWTGTRMVVWGGNTGNSSGGRYDPATDSWESTSTSGAPAPRVGHAAVWTGGEMIVWGGTSSGNSVNTGGRYEPISDVWSPITQNGAPLNSGHPLAIWTGDAMLTANSFDSVSTMHRYDPGADRWQQKAGMSGFWGGDDPAFGCGEMVLTKSTGEWTAYNLATDTYGALFAPVLGGSMVSGAGNLMLWQPPDDGWVSCRCVPTVPPPGKVTLLKLAKAPAHLLWADDGVASGYDVVRGSLGTLRSSGGNFTTATQTCLANGTADNFLMESTAAPAGGFFYLVRVSDVRGNGTYDTGAASQVGLRDAEIAASAGVCP
jgi:N-acetylneuraminic acid mutarotase